MLHGAIRAGDRLVMSHISSFTVTRVLLFRHTDLAIICPPPHGAEQCESGVSTQSKNAWPSLYLHDFALCCISPPSLLSSEQTPHESILRLDPIFKSHPTR